MIKSVVLLLIAGNLIDLTLTMESKHLAGHWISRKIL